MILKRVTKRLSRWILSVIGTTLGLALALSNALAQAHPLYQMLDSGFPAEDAFPVVWIDNYRVMFTGVELGKLAEQPSQPYYYRGLKNAAFVWDVSQNKVTKFKDVILSTFCSTGSYISYRIAESQSKKQTVVVYAGQFGVEKKLGSSGAFPYHNPTSCRYYSKPFLPVGRKVGFLLEHDGFVDFGPIDGRFRTVEDREDSRPKLRSLDNKRVIPLDIDPRYRANWTITFSYLPFANQYLARGDTGNSSELTPAIYLSPQGSIRMVEFPTKRSLGGRYSGVRPGVFLSTDGDRQPGSEGGYLLTDSRLTKVVTGTLRRTSASPDGCKVAFVYAPHRYALSDGYSEWKQGKPGNTIRMVDLCEGVQK